MKRLNNVQGFTLVEMIVVMAVFIVVIMITGDAFNTILKHTSKLFRSEESNVEGIIGLEMLRHDIQQAGYGLFWEQSDPAATYTGEAAAAPANAFNDGTSGPPRAVVTATYAAATNISDDASKTSSILPGSDYLVIKATSVARNSVAQKWSYLKYSSGSVTVNNWLSAAENFVSSPSDKVVVLRRVVSSSNNRVILNPDQNGDSYVAYSNAAFDHMSSASTQVMTVYGVDNSATLRMPFNRTDYFVAKPPTGSKPSVCSANDKVGVLYKATVNQIGGTLNFTPILDCVADMQVVLGWDLRDSGCASGTDGQVDTWSNANGTVTTKDTASNASCALVDPTEVANAMADPATIRNSLKVIKVYILAQQGRKDSGYTSTNPLLVGDSGESSLTRSFTLDSDMLNYRWKVYRIVTRPKNLLSNQ